MEGLSPGPVELCSPPVSPSLPTAEGERVATPVGVILPWIYQHSEWDLWLGNTNRTNVQTVPVLYVYLIQNCLTYCNVRTSTLTIEYAKLLCFLWTKNCLHHDPPSPFPPNYSCTLTTDWLLELLCTGCQSLQNRESVFTWEWLQFVEPGLVGGVRNRHCKRHFGLYMRDARQTI